MGRLLPPPCLCLHLAEHPPAQKSSNLGLIPCRRLLVKSTSHGICIGFHPEFSAVCMVPSSPIERAYGIWQSLHRLCYRFVHSIIKLTLPSYLAQRGSLESPGCRSGVTPFRSGPIPTQKYVYHTQSLVLSENPFQVSQLFPVYFILLHLF